MEYGTTPDGRPVTLHVLTNGRITAKVISFGAILTELHVPDRNGRTADVVLGFDRLEDYVTANRPHFGATIGRFANRIAGGVFSDGQDYTLALNNGPNALHGGLKGFDKVVCSARVHRFQRRSRRSARVHEPRWRGGLPRHSLRACELPFDARRRSPDSVRGHHRPGNADQPHQP